MNWKIFVGLVLVALGALFVVYRIVNKPHKDIESAKVDYTLNLSTLMDEFANDLDGANTKYADKVLMIEGEMTDLQNGEHVHLFLTDGAMGIASCEMLDSSTDYFIKGENIKIKGLFVGFDDLIEPTITMKKCTILK